MTVLMGLHKLFVLCVHDLIIFCFNFKVMEEMKMILGKSDKEIEQLMYRGKKCVRVLEHFVPKDKIKNKLSSN